MAAAGGQVVIVFNGEIYNFRALRAELEASGHVFHTQTDTEVLLALYLEHGTEFLHKLNGIFAFALWDDRSKSLFVARDGMGVKPLYFSESGNSFAFASEIKALLCLPWIPVEIDEQALAHYIRYLWCPGTRTPLRHVKKLVPGEALIVRDGHLIHRWKHYSPPAPGPDLSVSVEDWIGEIRQVLSTAVQRQMISDVPLGAFLSGGLDSSAIVAYARAHAHGRLQCFTIDMDSSQSRKEGIVDDLPFAKKVAAHLDVDLHVISIGSEVAEWLSNMVYQLDEPQADPASLNVFFISELARRHGIKVLLSGAGGDDLFTGYRRHRALNVDTIWDHTPSHLRRYLAHFGGLLPAHPPILRRAGKFLGAARMDGNERLASYFDWTSPEAVRSLFRPEIAARLTEEPLLESLKAMPATATRLQRMLLLEQKHFLADHNLNYTDKMSMAAGVEVRVPFLDSDVVRLAARIPDHYRQNGSTGKWILKKAMEGVLPDGVIYRPKTGFGAPLRAWLLGPLKGMAHDLLSPESLTRRGLFDPRIVARMMTRNEQGRADYSYSILSLMCVELWCREFIDRSVGASCIRNSYSLA